MSSFDDPVSMPENPVSIEEKFGSLPKDIPQKLYDCIIECHDELTASQLNQVADYFREKASKFRSSLESNITIEDFEKLKKTDVDGDNEEGEKE